MVHNPFLTEYLYMLASRKRDALVYSPPGTTASEAWENYEAYQPEGSHALGTGMNAAALRRKGYHAVQVRIEIIPARRS